ncbi:expressed unknown protein [Seminavis robusta]|uniref:Uncharacterized protein n=1 Tax=Seminavis robusta TaxID=568900 RepID=A0A9N8EHT2_9STRA|nr:expressed unknown protein [Seminavis robusta]|eukprot:Sro1212_g252920.1 n/a (128) ;mRNA; f:23112-23495
MISIGFRKTIRSFFVGFLTGMVVLRQMPLALQAFTEQETVVNNQPTNSSAIAITIDTTSRIVAGTEDVQNKHVARVLDTDTQPQQQPAIEQQAMETDQENPVQQEPTNLPPPQQQQVDQQQQMNSLQ